MASICCSDCPIIAASELLSRFAVLCPTGVSVAPSFGPTSATSGWRTEGEDEWGKANAITLLQELMESER